MQPGVVGHVCSIHPMLSGQGKRTKGRGEEGGEGRGGERRGENMEESSCASSNPLTKVNKRLL